MKNVITIDGPSGVGKTTIGKEIANKYNYTFFSSGILYRYVAKYSYDNGSNNYDEYNLKIDNRGNCYVNNHNYHDTEIYNKQINSNSSEIAKDTRVRELVKDTLINFYKGIENGLVIEGRDMGSVVFPNAKYKFYLDADQETRGKRREDQSDSEETIKDIKQRDYKDMNRKSSPLVIPKNAIVINNTNKTKEETIKEIIKKIELL